MKKNALAYALAGLLMLLFLFSFILSIQGAWWWRTI